MSINWLVVLGSGLIPLLIGFVWYHPKVFGTVWFQLSGVSEEKAKTANMPLIFGLTVVFGIFLAFAMMMMSIHQMHMMSTLMNVPGFGQEGTEVNNYYLDFMTKYGNEFRTFKHGAAHGLLGGLITVLPVIAVNGLFEQKSFKYILINTGYWVCCMILMGGFICAYA